MRRSSLLAVVAAVFSCLVLASPSYAQTTYGVRAGFAADPDQLVVGGHLESPGLTNSGRLRLRPSVEIGIGSDTAIVAANMDFVYVMPFPASEWSTYFGGGPSFNIVHEDFAGNDVHVSASFIAVFSTTWDSCSSSEWQEAKAQPGSRSWPGTSSAGTETRG